MPSPHGRAVSHRSCGTIAPRTCRAAYGLMPIIIALLVLLATPITSGLETPWEAVTSGASVQAQGLDCSRIPNCEQCFAARNDDSITEVFCRTCKVGYRAAAAGSSCGKPLDSFWLPRCTAVDAASPASLHLTQKPLKHHCLSCPAMCSLILR